MTSVIANPVLNSLLGESQLQSGLLYASSAGRNNLPMDKLVIRGGNPLLGTIRISGAKNAALPCMAAALLTDETVILENIPQVRDIETTRKLLAAMGAEVELGYGRAQHRTTICCRNAGQPGSVLRTGQDHARLDAGARAAGGALRPRPRLAARRLRHRRAPHRPAHQGAGAAGRKDHAGARLRRSLAPSG